MWTADGGRCGNGVVTSDTRCARPPEAGFDIITEGAGKLLRSDDYGNKQALLVLKVVGKKSNLKVRVGRHFRGDLIIASEIETVD